MWSVKINMASTSHSSFCPWYPLFKSFSFCNSRNISEVKKRYILLKNVDRNKSIWFSQYSYTGNYLPQNWTPYLILLTLGPRELMKRKIRLMNEKKNIIRLMKLKVDLSRFSLQVSTKNQCGLAWKDLKY